METSKKIVYYIILLLFAGFSKVSTAQRLTIEFTNKFDMATNNNFYLLTNPLDGKQTLVDSVINNKDNKVTFRFRPENPEGLYTLLIYYFAEGKSGHKKLDFLYDKKDIEFRTNIFPPVDSMQVIKSDINKKYFRFEQKQKYYTDYYQKLYDLAQFLSPNDSLNLILYNRGQIIMKQKKELESKILNNTQNDIASKYLHWKMNSIITYGDLKNKREQLKKTYLQNFDFADGLILNVNLINQITSNYLALYKYDNISRDAQQDSINKAIDNLMEYYYVNEELQDYVLNNLSKGFKQIGMDKVVLHIYNNYLLPSMCGNEEAEQKIKAEAETLEKLQPGNTAPDFEIDRNGITDLYSINNKKIIVMFWATWCSHCQMAVPKIYKVLKNRKDISVVAIALDDDKKVWQQEISKYSGWIHLRAPEKWDDPLAKLYAIYATPTIYVLDSNFNIIGKVGNYYELIDILNE